MIGQLVVNVGIFRGNTGNRQQVRAIPCVSSRINSIRTSHGGVEGTPAVYQPTNLECGGPHSCPRLECAWALGLDRSARVCARWHLRAVVVRSYPVSPSNNMSSRQGCPSHMIRYARGVACTLGACQFTGRDIVVYRRALLGPGKRSDMGRPNLKCHLWSGLPHHHDTSSLVALEAD